MATGTGLPTLNGAPVLAQAPGGVSGDALFNANSWSQIAQSGEKLAKAGGDYLKVAEHKAQVGYLADQDVEIQRKQIELRNQFANDPKGFDAEWSGYAEGKLAEVQPYAVNHVRAKLGHDGNSAYSAILNERRNFNEKQDAERITALATLTGNDVIGSAMAGTLAAPEGRVRLEKYRSVLDSAVTSGLMTVEKRDLMFEDTLSKAEGEAAARSGVDVYREQGFDAAVKRLKSDILENEALGMKPESRYKAFNRGLSAIRLQQAQDKQDRGEYVAVSTDLRARIDSNQPIDPSEVRDTLKALQQTGAAAEFQRLSVSAATADATAPYRSGLRLKEFATAVAGRRDSAAPPEAAAAAVSFFMGRGYTTAQAQGIVGNLIHESGLNPNAVHDNNTGLGIAGHRLERLDAMRAFARERGKPVNDFQTQLEFIDQELRTTEGKAGAAVRAATTPEQAAAAFVHFERPLGYDPNDPTKAHGYSNRVGQAKRLGTGSAEDVPGVPPAGAVTKKVQEVFVQQAQAAWPDFKKKIDAGQTLDAEDMNAIHYAALLSGKANWIGEVEALATANQIGLKMAVLPENQRQAVIDQAQGQLSSDVNASLRKQFDRQNKMVRDSPVDFAIERGQSAPDPINLSSSDAARAGVGLRVNMARGVAQQQEVAAGSPFRDADRAQMAAAIARGDPKQAVVAMDALTSVPDEMLVPALKSPEIKDAIGGAVRSSDPARYGAAMSFLDKMWARAPETTKQMFGDDAVHSLMTWQSNLRYATPDALAQERQKATLDPQVRERQKKNTEEGLKLAREYSAADITKQFDTSWWITPGVAARAIGTQPLAPVDAFTRDALMGDFETQFARRFAETGDKAKALEQTTALMKTKWAGSPVNGGRLMVNGPEKHYPAIDGSHDWMTRQIEADLATRLGRPKEAQGGLGRAGTYEKQWDFALVSDRQTGAEAQAGQPPSYQVVITDAATGRLTLMPERYKFDAGPDSEKRRADFEWQRRRVLEQQQDPSLGSSMLGAP
jgi:hypothetical protein